MTSLSYLIPAIAQGHCPTKGLIDRVQERTYTVSTSKNNKYIYPTVTLDSDPIEDTIITKFFGVHIDQGLTWGDHVDVIPFMNGKTLYV